MARFILSLIKELDSMEMHSTSLMCEYAFHIHRHASRLSARTSSERKKSKYHKRASENNPKESYLRISVCADAAAYSPNRKITLIYTKDDNNKGECKINSLWIYWNFSRSHSK
jgi:hypothetical protein